MAVDSKGTRSDPLPNKTNKPEPKVVWSAVGAYLASLVFLVLLNALTSNNNELLFDLLPDAIEVFVVPFVPGIVAFVSGFAARHQYRRAEVQSSTPPGNLD